MTEQEAKALLQHYKEGTATEAEKALVEQWLFQFNEHESGLDEAAIEAIKAVQTMQVKWRAGSRTESSIPNQMKSFRPKSASIVILELRLGIVSLQFD